MGCKHVPIPVNTRFGRLVSTSETSKPTAKGEIYYKCICDCGSEPKFYATWKLRSSHTRSCGCFRKDARKLAGRLTLITKGIELSDAELDWIAKIQKEIE